MFESPQGPLARVITPMLRTTAGLDRPRPRIAAATSDRSRRGCGWTRSGVETSPPPEADGWASASGTGVGFQPAGIPRDHVLGTRISRSPVDLDQRLDVEWNPQE